MRPNLSRAGIPIVEMAMNAGVMVAMATEEGAETTGGGSLKKAPTQWAGTTTGQVLDVGVSQTEPPTTTTTPPAAAAATTLGPAAEGQIPQTRARRTPAPTGATQSTNPILRVAARAGESQ